MSDVENIEKFKVATSNDEGYKVDVANIIKYAQELASAPKGGSVYQIKQKLFREVEKQLYTKFKEDNPDKVEFYKPTTSEMKKALGYLMDYLYSTVDEAIIHALDEEKEDVLEYKIAGTKKVKIKNNKPLLAFVEQHPFGKMMVKSNLWKGNMKRNTLTKGESFGKALNSFRDARNIARMLDEMNLRIEELEEKELKTSNDVAILKLHVESLLEDNLKGLTPRETFVKLYECGWLQKDIAAKLGKTERTIRNWVSQYKKEKCVD